MATTGLKRDAPVLPLGSPGSWDDTEVETPYVIFIPTNPDSMKYMMWYSGATPDSSLFDTVCLGFPLDQIDLAYSDDGLSWTKYNNPANDSLPLFAESDPVLTISSWTDCTPDVVNEKAFAVAEPCVLYKSGTYKMYHIGLGCSTPFCLPQEDLRYRVLYAESADGINWGPFQVIVDIGDSDAFDSRVVYSPDVTKLDNEYWMFYAGGADTTLDVWNCDMGLAIPQDGINFTKSANNPLIQRVAASWTDYGMNAASSIIFHDTFRVYYSGLTFTPSIMPTIGYSYLDSTLIMTVKDAGGSGIPSTFELSQNYPNPFNSVTTITYRLSTDGRIRLTIKNLLGENVQTLVNEYESAGSYFVAWDGKDRLGKDVTSGIYFSQLKVDNLMMTKKLILIR
ncbi:MAG: T9SS type A sorting domain-containing protein [Fidelibacterota bacterium]